MRDGARNPRRRGAPRVPNVVVAALLLALPALSRAEPYLMVREGAKCSDCHTNLTGGGKRTSFVFIHGHELLHDLQILPIPQGVKAFNGELTPWASVGADLRVRDTVTWGQTPNAQGKVPGNRFFRPKVESNQLAVTQFTTYLQLDLLPDMLTVYADENFNGTASNREAWGMLRGVLPWGFFAKAGRFFLPFGLQVWDDQAFIRQNTGYTFSNPAEGLELGIIPGPLFFTMAVTNGISGDSDVEVTTNAYTLWDEVPVVKNVMLGTSFGRQSNKRDVVGFYAGANLWKFTYLAEFDLIDDRRLLLPSQKSQYAAYAELDLLLWDWFNIHTEYDFVKIGGGNDQTRWVIGAEPFIDRFLQPRIQYRANMGPRDQPSLNQPQLWIELHMFF